jgi:hypothetical protein
MKNITTTETVSALKSNQVIFPQWMEDAVSGMTDTDFVNVTRQCTPFGNYVLGIERADKE